MKKISKISFEIRKKDFLWGLGVVLFIIVILFVSFKNNDFDVENKNNSSFEEYEEKIIVVDNVYEIGNGRIEVHPPKDGFSEIIGYRIPEEYTEIVFTNNRTNKSTTERIINGEINSKIEAEENDIILFTIK